MSQSFTLNAIVFIIVMIILHIIKDIINKIYTIPPALNSHINKRWLINTAIGLILLYFIYGREGPN